MKEAAGEANMTVITIVLIAVVLGVGIILVPKLMKGTSKKACCTNNGGLWTGTKCCDPSSTGTSCTDDSDPSTCTCTTEKSTNC